MDLKWRFPDNGNGKEVGLETGDIDIFKKDPIGSLAREICQSTEIRDSDSERLL